MATLEFKLQGLHCEACVKMVSMDLSDIPGVTHVAVDLASGQTKVTADRQIKLEEISRALADTEYKITNN